ncbi:MAG: T9SS type A sorting domain-containing protein, partial [Flavobacterium sp.]|nr:T9SS type A sorting domain-containing protein [Flavobacterium sp.]
GNFRQYRLAIACTIEYSAFHLNAAGTPTTATLAQKKAVVLSAMVVSMTRLNGVYEKEMSLRMNLVANNDLIIFIDSDNFTNSPAMIDEIQPIVDAAIGFGNYDMGHGYCTTDSGVAQLASVCGTGKARGITGQINPVGDPFDIDYVAHEMGHQWGASHTQNNACNRSAASAYEPGSASTILGYAGICSPNVQNNSDAYFHARSILQMSSFVTSASASCRTIAPNGNIAPVVNAGSNFIIPKSTPFILKGSATDANGDALTYCWEQYNNEVSTQPPLPTATSGPNFRSLTPSNSPERYMPRIQDVINNNIAPTWEVVPSVPRTMNFALTVRDNRVGGGMTKRGDMTVTTANVGPFLVNSPNTAVTWFVGANQNVSWDVAGTTANGVNTAFVDIFLSTDGGLTYPIQLASQVPNNGNATIIVPNNVGTTNRVMVKGYQNIFFDISNVNFSIVTPTATFAISESGPLTNQICTGSSTVYNFNYSALGGFSGTATFSATGNPSGSSVVFNPPTMGATSGLVTMTVNGLTGVAAGSYNITATANSGTITDNIPFVLNLGVPNATLLSPSNNATAQNISLTLTWDSVAVATSYDVQVSTNNTFTAIVSSGTVTSNSYSASGLTQGTTYFWRVLPKNATCTGIYSSPFTFTTGTISCATTSSSNVPVAISSSGAPTITSTLTIPSGGSISDVNVSLNLSHTYVGDLTAILTSPSGTIVELFNRRCTSNDNINVTFDDSGIAIVCGTNPAISGTVLPAQSLSAFNGLNSTGTWTLSITDGFDLDGGSLNSWSLNICTVQALSSNNFEFQDFALFPNPNKGSFTVKFLSETSSNIDINIHDISGRQVYKKSFVNNGTFNQNIELNNVQKGIYLVSIQEDDKKTVKRIIVE